MYSVLSSIQLYYQLNGQRLRSNFDIELEGKIMSRYENGTQEENSKAKNTED
jgi:hypothetical protein